MPDRREQPRAEPRAGAAGSPPSSAGPCVRQARPEHVARSPIGADMSFNCSSNRPGVAAAHGQHDRKTPLRRFSKNELISAPQALGGQPESTERLIAQRVYARLTEDNLPTPEAKDLQHHVA